MSEEQVQRLVAEVISRLAVRLGADGSRGLLLIVFTGATAGFIEAIQQVRRMVMSGYRVQIAFSRAAGDLYGRVVRTQLAGFPHVEYVDPGKWLSALQGARAVVVPLLSVNTLSKLTLLIADDLSTNLILHGLLMGKPVIVARNGADPEDPYRRELGFHLGTPALRNALVDRLRTLSGFGGVLTDVTRLSDTVQSALAGQTPGDAGGGSRQGVDGGRIPDTGGGPSPSVNPVRTLPVRENVITSVHVTQAYRANANLQVRRGAIITPLARELAARCRVGFSEQ